MEKEVYEIGVQCHNCKHVPRETITNEVQERVIGPVVGQKLFIIPKGTEVKTFLREMTCENCGCDGFMGIL